PPTTIRPLEQSAGRRDLASSVGTGGYLRRMAGYVPRMSPERVEWLRRWHEEASVELHALGAQDVDYLGLRLHVPEHVFPPTPTSDLLGREVLARARAEHRVLDMGCGAGANAILAARNSRDVTGVDVSPLAVSAAAAN